MAKKSRRPVRATTPTSSTAQSATPTSQPSTSVPAYRSTTRPRSRRVQQSFFEKYRTVIIGGAAVVGILIVGYVFFQGASTAAYSCGVPPAQTPVLMTPGPVESLTPAPPTLTPTATPASTPAPTTSGTAAPTTDPAASGTPGASASPAASPTAEPTPVPEPTPRLGFTNEILGRNHVPYGTSINYAFCPPSSGSHYNDPPRAPLPAQFYGPADEKIPGTWIHNLEHGFVVMLYRCPSGTPGVGDCPTQAEMDQMRQFFDEAPPPHVATCPKKVLVARFDSMDTQFGELAWGRSLLTNDFDLDTALIFAQQWMEHGAVPEPNAC